MTRSRLTRVFVAASALAVSNSAAALAHGTAEVRCGSVLTTNTVLTHDLIGCVGDGLVIGADDIKVDLNGHRITGDGVEDPNDMGIRVTGHQRVRVTNGMVQGFSRGIVFDGSSAGVVTSMTVRQMTGRGIVFDNGSDGARVVGNVSADNVASGIAIVASDGASVVDNQSLRNIDGAGVRLEGSTHSLVTRNTLNADVYGVQMQDADGNRVVNNTISGATEAAVVMDFASRNLVDRNHILRSGSGVLIGGNDNVITRNQILHSVGPDGIGVQLDGNRNLIARNTVIDPVRYGIEVDNFGELGQGPAVGNVLRGNVISGGGEGIAVGPEAGGVVLKTVVEGNRVTGAVDDGIQVLGSSTGLETTTITANVAVRNGNLGIEAVPGVTDGGGNRARGNGNALQCLNIACR